MKITVNTKTNENQELYTNNNAGTWIEDLKDRVDWLVYATSFEEAAKLIRKYAKENYNVRAGRIYTCKVK